MKEKGKIGAVIVGFTLAAILCVVRLAFINRSSGNNSDLPTPTLTSTPIEMPTDTPSLTSTPGLTSALSLTLTPSLTPTTSLTTTPGFTATPSITATPSHTLYPSLQPTIAAGPSPTDTIIPTDTSSPTATCSPTKETEATRTPTPSNTASPTPQPIDTPTPTPTVVPLPSPTGTPIPTATKALTPTPTVEVQQGTGILLDFSKYVDRFDESFFTVGCKGTYKVPESADFYNADGSYAGTLPPGSMVYANASNTYYKGAVTYRNNNGKTEEFVPDCGKAVYQVVIQDKNYYMNPNDLYGSYMGTGIEYPAGQDETEAFCIAEGQSRYYQGSLRYYDKNGKGITEKMYLVKVDDVYHFVSMDESKRITDNYLTYRIPFREFWVRSEGDAAQFSEIDSVTGHRYVWKDNTCFFLDLDYDGIAEYEVTVDEWNKWQALN